MKCCIVSLVEMVFETQSGVDFYSSSGLCLNEGK